jgi:hypothetical protein
MGSPRFAFVVAVGLAPLASGCAHGGEALLGAGLVAGAAVASAALDHPDPDEVIYDRVVVVHDAPPDGPPPPPYPPLGLPAYGPPGSPPPAPVQTIPPPVEPPLAAFDREHARALLQEADVPGCRSQGAPHGLLHAAVVFVPSGATSQVAIAAPIGLSAEALACIGKRVGAVKVAPFVEGDERLVDVTWIVP